MIPVAACILSDDERILVREIEDPGNAPRRDRRLDISAQAVRALVLQQPVAFASDPGTPQDVRVVQIPVTGFVVTNCVVRGNLNLDDACREDGGALPPLTLSQCIFFTTVSIQRARFRMLSFASSRFTELLADGVRLEGPLVLTQTSTSESDPTADSLRNSPNQLNGYNPDGSPTGMARISLTRAHIGGDLDCSLASLSIHKAYQGDIPARPRQYALDLSMAIISGNLYLMRAKLSGGLNATLLNLGGGLLATAASFLFPGNSCLDMESAQVGGSVVWNADAVDSSFHAEGTINLNNTVIRGSLFLQGADLNHPAACGHTLHLNRSSVSGDVNLSPFAGNAETPDWPQTHSCGKIEIRSSRIGGDMNLTRLWFRDFQALQTTPLGRTFGTVDQGLRPEDEDQGDDELARINQNIPYDRRDVLELIDATETSIAGRLSVQIQVNVAYPRRPRFPFYPRINLSGMTVGELDDINGSGWGDQVNLVLNRFRVLKLPDRSRRIFSLFSIARVYSGSGRTMFYLEILLVNYLLPVVAVFAFCWHRPRFALLVLAVHILLMTSAGLLGGPSGGSVRNALRLLAQPVSLLLQRGDPILNYRPFLDRQFHEPKRPYLDEYFPGVYDSLSKQLREDGREQESKAILAEKLRVQRRVAVTWYAVPFWAAFDLFFGHGFSALRAFTTFALCLICGSLGVRYANSSTWPWPHNPVLVVSTSTVNTLALYNQDGTTHQPDEQPYAITLQKAVDTKAQPAGEILCGARIDPWLYSLELFVPALDLHQTSQCEVSASDTARGWRKARAVYTIIGWVVTSITILTVPGILRRRAEE